MMVSRYRVCLGLLLCFAGVSRSHAEMLAFLAPGSVIEIVNLGQGSKPLAINNHGDVVGQNSSDQATLWRNGQQQTLGSLGGATSIARVINDNGTIAGQADLVAGGFRAAQWSTNDPTSVINLDPVATLSSAVLAINNDDVKVGFKTNGTINRSSIWGSVSTGGNLIFGGGNHMATGINDDFEIVGVDVAAGGGFYHNGSDSLTDFTSGLGTSYFPTAGINNNQVTAGKEGNAARFLRVGDIDSTSIPLIGLDSEILNINDNDILVGHSVGEGIAFDLSTGQTFNLNDFIRTGFAVDSIISVTDINENNEFVGLARFDNALYGFSGKVVTVVPEPSLYGLFTLPFLGRKRNRRPPLSL